MGRKTHEQFMEDFNKKNEHAKDIEILGTYQTAHTKIKCKCKVCGHEWEAKPNVLLSRGGTGCPKCGRKTATKSNTKTHEQFLEKLHKVNPHIQILETYKNSATPILCRCKIDAYEWKATPRMLLQGHGCPVCGYKKISISKTKTHEQFIHQLYKQNKHAKDIEVLGTYVNSQNKILCRCKKCGHEWKAVPKDLLQGHGCPKCARNAKPTHEEFIEKFYKQNKHSQDIEVLGTYKTAKTKIKCKCKVCGHEWTPTPNRLLAGQGCPKCAGRLKTHEEFIIQLQQINPDIEVIGKYMTTNTKLKVKCKRCGHIWEATPNNLLSGWGCPKCNISRGEKRIAQYLDNLDIDYIYNTCYFNDLVGTGGGLMRPDFIIPSLKIWIEYDGQQHFEPVNFIGAMSEEQVQERFEYTQQNDKIKNQYAKDNNWTLIRIPYWEIDNIEQILDSYLKQEEELAL